ncbi:glutamate-cysteine ligase family protein [Streptomyces sp. NPDC006627]|uniref:carboxylate-amine ligase n=1 Tax=Streptomyces sp. NPDC006627 TaxID=3154679 RepID=UPI0033B8A070
MASGGLGGGRECPARDGQDTGFASWRTVVFGRRPVSGPPPRFADLTDYEDRVDKLLSSGMIQDVGQLYWQARPSRRHPTIEVRCPDVQLRVDEAVMLTGIVRGSARPSPTSRTASRNHTARRSCCKPPTGRPPGTASAVPCSTRPGTG